MAIRIPKQSEPPKANGTGKDVRNGHGKKTSVKGKKSKGISSPTKVRKK